MNAITHPPPTVKPDDDPIAVALSDPATRRDLMAQAMSRLNLWLADRPRASREQEAEEIVNEVFERVWTNRAKYDSERAGIRAWMSGFLPRVLAEYCRKLRRAEELPIAFQHRHRERTIDVSFEGWNLDDALKQIPPEERKLVVWACVDELTHREIGDRLKITEANSRQRLKRIMSKLERIIASLRGEGQS